jgi:5-methylcytosine-specific restriction protein A
MCPGKTRDRGGFCDKHQDRARKPWEGSGWRKRTMSGGAWAKLRKQILERDAYQCRCEECRLTGEIHEATEVDHVVSLARGGTDDPSNLQAISAEHHRSKTQREARGGYR